MVDDKEVVSEAVSDTAEDVTKKGDNEVVDMASATFVMVAGVSLLSLLVLGGCVIRWRRRDDNDGKDRKGERFKKARSSSWWRPFFPDKESASAVGAGGGGDGAAGNDLSLIHI